jgi:hypothetical protein
MGGKTPKPKVRIHAVRDLGTSAKEDYERLDRAATEARVKSEQARLALEQHIAAHRC